MNKFVAAIVTSAFVFGSISGYAADTVKKEELTKEQRTDMRNRADKLTQERAQAGTPVKTDVKSAPATKTPHAKKTHKTSNHPVKKTQPKA